MLAVLLCMSVLPMLAENAPAEQANKILNGIVHMMKALRAAPMRAPTIGMRAVTPMIVPVIAG